MTADVHRAHLLSIAVIGTGPRGLSVLERLAVRLRDAAADGGNTGRAVRIYAIDAVEVGAGRVWRTDQPDWFTMNTVVSQVTMYSGDPDGGPSRPGAGPSLGQWIAERARTHGEPALGPDDYASRQRYGQYLKAVFENIRTHLPAGCELLPVKARVTSLTYRDPGGYHIELDDGRSLVADKALLATGHPTNAPSAFERGVLAFTERHPHLHYVSADSAAEMDLSPASIPAGSAVGILGMGLSFYDVMLSLTVGRGGTFATGADGRLAYRAGGAEPRIVAASRSGLPIPARGRNQKPPQYSHRARFLTSQALEDARARRQAESGSPRLDFDEDVLPLLLREVEHVYYTTHLRNRHGQQAADRFALAHQAAAHDLTAVLELLAAEGLNDLPQLDVFALARPFAGRQYAHPDQFRAELLQRIADDLAEAELGNHDGPLKSALDVLRDIRNAVREAVDYGGLLPESHREAFLGRFLPVNALLSAGPPRERVHQLLALIEAGLVEVAGPDARFTLDDTAGAFHIHSPHIAGAGHHVRAFIDARIPTPRLSQDTSPLIRRLLADGLISEYKVTDLAQGQHLDSGGLAVTQVPFHTVDRHGKVQADLYALGIPTEHTRWFTQVGSSRPGLGTLFYQDADAIAADMLACATEPRIPRPRSAAAHWAEQR